MITIDCMTAYKRRDCDFNEFDPETFDRDKPWFCRLWGFDENRNVELVAFVGPTFETYFMRMPKVRFQTEYCLD